MPAATEAFGLSKIGQIAVNVRDLPRAIGFYRDTLGMRFLFEVPQMAFFDCGGVRLMLGLPSGAEFDHPASILYYQVDDIQGARDTLVARGVRFTSEPHRVARMPDHELWIGFFPDSEGNVLAVMSEVRPAA
jgi:catechol 2,3-dioxygenase-like lactoylglutathione lyase family enzyme